MNITETPELLEAEGDAEVWVVVSGWTFTQAYYPDVAERLARSQELKRFPSQNPDLDLVVVRLDP